MVDTGLRMISNTKRLIKVRIGSPLGKEGYVLLKELCEKTEEVVSWGVAGKFLFELDFLSRFSNVKKITLVDPTIEKPPSGVSPKLQFTQHPLFCPTSGEVLKMDVGESVWDILTCMNNLMFEKHSFDQMVLRLPFSSLTEKGDLITKYAEVLQELTDYFVFHVSNPLPLIMGLNERSLPPPLLDVSLVRKGLVSDAGETSAFLLQ